MDVRDHSTPGDGGLDQRVELLVTADRELEMARRDTLDLEVLAGVAGELEDLGGQVLKDGGRVDGGGGTDTLGLLDGGLEETVDTTDGELSSLLVLGIFKRYGYGGDEKGDETSRKRGYRYHMFFGRPVGWHRWRREENYHNEHKTCSKSKPTFKFRGFERKF